MRKYLLCVIASALFINIAAYAAFRDTAFGVRPEGMGGAFVAVSDDINAIHYNPAGLGKLIMREASFVYGVPFAGLPGVWLKYVNVNGAWPVKGVAGFGAAYTDYEQSDLYRERVIAFAAGRNIGDIFKTSRRIFAGLALKYLWHGYSTEGSWRSDPVFRSGSSKGALSIDLGLLYPAAPSVDLGISIRDLSSPNVGLLSEDKVPSEVSFGAAWKLPAWKAFEDITVPVEYSMRGSGTASQTLRLGIESWFMFHTLGVRAGFNSSNAVNLGFSYYKALDKYMLKLDYSIGLISDLGDNSGSHRLALGLRF